MKFANVVLLDIILVSTLLPVVFSSETRRQAWHIKIAIEKWSFELARNAKKIRWSMPEIRYKEYIHPHRFITGKDIFSCSYENWKIASNPILRNKWPLFLWHTDITICQIQTKCFLYINISVVHPLTWFIYILFLFSSL